MVANLRFVKLPRALMMYTHFFMSQIRTLAGIGFEDPAGKPYDESVHSSIAQMVLADVIFTPESSILANQNGSYFGACLSTNGAFLSIPLTELYQKTHGFEPVKTAFRIGFTVPLEEGAPPSNPGLDYLQEHIDSQGPHHLSSDPSVNPNPVTASKLIWSTRYRIASAIADQFYTEMPSGAHIFVVGDAAHIHSPAGGQGMNLGIRDAIGLGKVIAEHIQSPNSQSQSLRDYAEDRHQKALQVIGLTKTIGGSVGNALSNSWLFSPLLWIFGALGNLSFINRKIVWRLSGLGNR